MKTIIINGKKTEVLEGLTVLETAKAHGIYIPALCAHSGESESACRLCLVEMEGHKDLQTACTLPVSEGMVIWTDSTRVSRQRKRSLSRLLQEHPSCCLNCPRVEPCDGTVCQRKPDYEERCVTCAKNERCELQKAARYIKLGEVLLPYRRRNQPFWDTDPFLERNYNLCIACGQCVAACKDVLGVGALVLAETSEGCLSATARQRGTLKESGCRFCGVCAEVCPTSAIMQKIEKERPLAGRPEALVPCRFTCPAGIDVPAYVKHIAEGNYSSAYDVISARTPFAGTLSHICPHPCEGECRRLELNQPVAIRALKRFATERGNGAVSLLAPADPTGKQVAIVGAGPAGLTVAYHLAKLGHAVTVLEAKDRAGGMLWWGIPRFQLPGNVIQEDMQKILDLGVEIKYCTPIEDAEGLLQQGYDCVFLAPGLQLGRELPLPGAEGDGVLVALDFLAEANNGQAAKPGEKVLVLGGGDVAVDCALVARRLGVKEVSMACLESRETLPAHSWMMEEALEEGVQLYPSLTFTEILREEGKVQGVRCKGISFMQFDAEGRLTIEIKHDSDVTLEADCVIFAIGQDLKPLSNWGQVALTPRKTIAVDEASMATANPAIFAGGDAVSGPASVVQAIGSARKAAQAMDLYLGGTGQIDEDPGYAPLEGFWLGKEEGFVEKPGLVRKLLDPAARVACFDLVELPLEEEEARREAGRCLRCDLRLNIMDKLPVKAREELTG